MSSPKEKKVFIKYLTALEFELVRKTKHSELWKHIAKSISFQLSGSPSSHNWIHDAKRQFQKLISSNFDKDELQNLLEPFIKKQKVRFNKQGKIRVLRISGDLETNILRDLLTDDMSVHQELQEFYDGIDGTEELDDLNEKIKDMQFKVSKKDKRKTKIED